MNKSGFLFLLFNLFTFSIVFAQEEDTLTTAPVLEDTISVALPEPWHFGGNSTFTFAQVGLRNWAGGGQSSVSINTIQTFLLNYEQERFMWNNNLEVGLGFMRQGRGDNRTRFRKSDDRLIFISKFSRRAKGHWMFTGLLDFRTQMVAGYDYRMVGGLETRTMISDFLAPGFIITSIGWEYRRSQNFFVVVAPVTTKQTLVLHNRFAAAGQFGVEPGQKFRIEYGALFNARYRREIFENVTLDTRLNLFGNYEHFSSIDINWEFLILMKVNQYLSTSFSSHLLYDDDMEITREDGSVGPATQVKTVLNVGLIYKFDRR